MERGIGPALAATSGARGAIAVTPAVPRLARRVLVAAWRLAVPALLLTLAVGLALQLAHKGQHEAHELPPLLHWLRDSGLALPLAFAALATVRPVSARVAAWARLDERDPLVIAVAVLAASAVYALGSVPGGMIHARLFDAHHEAMGPLQHALFEARLVFHASFAALMALAFLAGAFAPTAARHRPGGAAARRRRRLLLGAILIPSLVVGGSAFFATGGHAAAPVDCARTIRADVVALDQELTYNRLGVINPAGMIYALRRDVVSTDGSATLTPGAVKLPADKRPRPLTLRANVGDCLRVDFQNLLDPTPREDQPADRHVGIHVNGMVLVGSGADGADAIDSDGSFVGRNASSLAPAPGGRRTYTLLAEHENTYLLTNPAITVGSEATGGTIPFGLFGAVNVEPRGTDWYRSQVTRDEMDAASTTQATDTTQPVLDYDAKADGVPVLNMLDDPAPDGSREIVHSDLNAIIAGPASAGYRIPRADYPESYWQNQIYNMNADRGAEPFREFTVIFHDEIVAKQAFDLFKDPKLRKTLAGVKDGFAINYGTGGIGAEIIANRLGVGPMWDCTECKYEEFFLTSWAVGDPAEIVDVPANTKDAAGNVIPGPKATKALYPDDPSNVHHSYINDRVKFRNLHAGPKEHHIFHLHAHQWLFTPNTKKSAYLDSQLVGPGSGYTYEIAFGGSGNRNKTVGDAIFHCHFYPHFAQGMWEMWRNHDTFERGTEIGPDGRPVPGARALPDAEIASGTPIPAIVPLPGRPMPPMPDADTRLVKYDPAPGADVKAPRGSSQLDANGDGVADVDQGFDFPVSDLKANPGFPFYIPGVAGHRPPTPPLDIKQDGGLPRHVLVGGTSQEFHTPLDFNKTLETAKPLFLPEQGSAAEQKAMQFHAALWHPTALPNGDPVDAAHPLPADPANPGARQLKGYETNGLPPVPGAPYADPCRADDPVENSATRATNRTYRGAVLQTDAVLNKLGWHFPQQRFETLDEDVAPTLSRQRAPEPLVMRLDVNDCTRFDHTNLLPNTYDLDDYQVRTPTDIVGQHIHLVKFDVTSADGSGNGYNYEDGTLSPQEIVERIKAIRALRNDQQPETCTGNALLDQPGETSTNQCPLAREHPFFTVAKVGADRSWGARTTIQRWYADPILNDAWDQGHGAVFTHDHYGPSTHQQVGLYSTVLVEPADSRWRDPETGTPMNTRADGGPTSWKADILWPAGDPRNAEAHREFYFEFADFQHAYQAGGGRLHTQDNGAGTLIPSYADFKNAINPSLRQEPPAGHEADLYWHPPTCASGEPRPCPEAISVDDVGTYVVNQRNEPVGLRVFDPVTRKQTAGPAGDLALAFQSRTDRAIAALNRQPTVYPQLTKDIDPGDPWTPTMRVYAGDKIRIRAQVGATEEEHNLTIHGLKWRQEQLNLDSGWRDTQAAGISEYFNLAAPVVPDLGPGSPARQDYLYEMGAATDDVWNGIWGLLRSYSKQRNDLLALPNNSIPAKGWTISNQAQFNGPCPTTAPARNYDVTAVRAADVRGPNGLTYNSRATAVVDQNGDVQGSGPLIDPTAIMYVNTASLVRNAAGKPVGLKPGTPVEPLVLRAAAGDCIKVALRNALPSVVPDLPGYNALPAIVHKDENVDGGIVSFNDNDLTPSSLVGLHPQLVHYDVRKGDGSAVGSTGSTLAAPGQQVTYQWYAGDVTPQADGASSIKMVARPIEFGAANLMPADPIKGGEKGAVGALVIEPPGATWTTDAGRNTSATVTYPDGSGATARFREFVPVLQSDVNLRYGGQCAPTAANLQCAVPGIGAEALRGPAEDAEDGGQKAIGYGAEPLWFRLGLAPTVPWTGAPDIGPAPVVSLLHNADVHRVYSNDLVGGDPQTPVFTAAAGQQIRIRMLEPAGHARGSVMAVHGHAWQREPYVSSSDRIGVNDTSQWIGAQEGIAPSSHFDFLIPAAGGSSTHGRFATGDFLFRDEASFGNYQGLWGLVRVTP